MRNVAVVVVTGLVQEFGFGMNRSAYSRLAGDISGAPLAMAGDSWMQHPDNTASGRGPLRLMTIVVLVLLPLVLLYQGWTHYVFRQRLSPGDFRPPRLLSGGPAGERAGPGKQAPDGRKMAAKRCSRVAGAAITRVRRCPRSRPALR